MQKHYYVIGCVLILALLILCLFYWSQTGSKSSTATLTSDSNRNSLIPVPKNSFTESQTSENLNSSNGGYNSMANRLVSSIGNIGPSKSVDRTDNFGRGVPIRLAFVKQSFTVAAYSYWSGGNAFYKFYRTFDSVKPGLNVTKNLQWLTTLPIDSLNETKLTPARVYPMLSLLGDLGNQKLNYSVDIIDDVYVDSGKIFLTNGSNAFDILLLGHQEYVTQHEYDNLKRFVFNGGTIIALDGNIFYAEVKYDERSHEVTLIKGHSWAYDGVSAWRDVSERWEKDLPSWIGGLTVVCSNCNESEFANNPFNYSNFEEQYIANSNDKIIFDYKYSDPLHKVSTYELKFGKGYVFVLGIYSDHVIRNPKFIAFFNTLVSDAASKYITR